MFRQDVDLLHVKKRRKSVGCKRASTPASRTPGDTSKPSLLWKHTSAIVPNLKRVFTLSHVPGDAKPEL